MGYYRQRLRGAGSINYKQESSANLALLGMCVLKNGRCSNTAASAQLQSHPSNLALSSTIIQSHIPYSSADASASCRYNPCSAAIYQYLSPLLNTSDQHFPWSRRIQMTPYRTAMHNCMSSQQRMQTSTLRKL